MARFIHWPSRKQVANHVLKLSAKAAKKFDDQIAVAECGTDLEVVLVKHDGSPASGTASLHEKRRKKDQCPVLLSGVNNGDRVRVLHKTTRNPWSTDLTILVEHAPATGGSLSAKATPDLVVPAETKPADVTLYLDIELNVEIKKGQGVATPMTAVYVPDRKKLTAPYNIIWWFHGHKKSSGLTIQEYLQDKDFNLREFILASTKRNFLLVAPTLGDTSGFGMLDSESSANAYLEQVLNGVHQHVFGSSGKRPDLGKIVLAGHSGGYRAMSTLAGFASIESKIREVWCFDSTYGGGKGWLQWATKPAAELDRLWAFSTGSWTKTKMLPKDPKKKAGPDNPLVETKVREGTGDNTDVFLNAANDQGLTNIEAYDKGRTVDKKTGDKAEANNFKAKYGEASGHNESVGFYFTKLVNTSNVLK